MARFWAIKAPSGRQLVPPGFQMAGDLRHQGTKWSTDWNCKARTELPFEINEIQMTGHLGRYGETGPQVGSHLMSQTPNGPKWQATWKPYG